MSQLTQCSFQLIAEHGIPNLSVSLLIKKMRSLAYDCRLSADELRVLVDSYASEVTGNNKAERKRISVTVTSMGASDPVRKFVNLVYNDDDDTKKIYLVAQLTCVEKGGQNG
ncbi:hypothetical protein [Runella limosa]|uniref:hypothetical protein n=1 Tax=Runella limosa TaxID=370978 RepID=UPI0005649E32|nr:hypothetical protein [Runella limosa]